MTDTDALMAKVREAFRDAQPIADTARFDAALDALAAELERLREVEEKLARTSAALESLNEDYQKVARRPLR